MPEIRFALGFVEDLKELRASERSRVISEIREKLSNEPTRLTKHVKLLRNMIPPFEAVPPLWQLRIANFRIFYDVDEETQTIFIRALRLKPPHRTTEDIL